jgi:hypothetical protein
MPEIKRNDWKGSRYLKRVKVMMEDKEIKRKDAFRFYIDFGVVKMGGFRNLDTGTSLIQTD